MLVAAHVVALQAGAAPEWIHVLPAGTFKGADGRGPYKLEDAAAVIAASLPAGGREILIDYDHATDIAVPKGGRAEAAGWIEELQARGDGIWARVRWTERAADVVKALEYRYVSPVFEHARHGGRIHRLLRASLTNNPNLNLVALAAAQTEGADMDLEKLLAELRPALGLPADAEPAKVVATATAMATVAKAAQDATTSLASIAKAAGLAETAKAEEIVTVVAAAKAGGEPDPTKYAPTELVKSLQTELASLKSGIVKDKAVAAVDAAIECGKLVPAMREWGLQLHARDAKAFDEFVAKSPQIVGDRVVKGAAPDGDGGGLTDTERAVCAATGVSEDDYRASSKQIKEARK